MIDLNTQQEAMVVHGSKLDIYWSKTKNYDNPAEEYWGLKIVVVPHYKEPTDILASSWLLDLSKSLCYIVGKVTSIFRLN